MNDRSLNLLFVHSTSIGYGRMGVMIARELERMGVTIYDHLPGLDAEHEKATAHLNQGRRSGVAKTACWMSTPSHANGWYDGQVPMIFSMWESSRLPEQFRESLHNFDTVIVPSQQNAELFGEYHTNVHIVPLGVDPDRWRFTPRRVPTNSFRFLIGGSGLRKGTDLARKAFRLAFPVGEHHDGPRPTLVMKSPRGEEVIGSDDIEVISGRLTDDDEVALYESAHCYLQPSRGEGFGLQPLQAMAQGIPTILTNAHGHAGFAHLGIPLDWSWSKSAYFIYGDAGDWWEPDLDQLVEEMRWVYANYEQECMRAERSAHTIADEWTWKRTAERFLQVVGEDNLGDLEGERTWFTPEFAKYLVVTNRDYISDVGGVMRFFAKGERYWEPADIKRILFECGVLDPVCLFRQAGQSADDIGMVDSQLVHIENYSAAQAYCPTCQQKLNSGPTRADEIYLELQREAGVT